MMGHRQIRPDTFHAAKIRFPSTSIPSLKQSAFSQLLTSNPALQTSTALQWQILLPETQ